MNPGPYPTPASGSTFHGPTQGQNVLPGLSVLGGQAHFNFGAGPASQVAGSARPCRVIPYRRNLDVVDRNDLFSRLDALLPSAAESHSAALWGLGGSGYVSRWLLMLATFGMALTAQKEDADSARIRLPPIR